MSVLFSTSSWMAPLAASGLDASQRLFRQELSAGGAGLNPVSLGELEDLASGHPFQGVVRQVGEAAGLSPQDTAAWRVDFEKFQGDSKAREVLGHNASFVNQGYYPQSLAPFLVDSAFTLAAVTSLHPSDFRLKPFSRMPSIEGLARLLEDDAWPLYAGTERVRIHGYLASPYGAALHDVLHYLAWKRWTREDRQDSVVLYRAMRSVVTTQIPTLGSLAGRIGARLFYGDGFFYREMTAMDECLSGPPGTGNGVFTETSLQNVASCLEGDRSRFYRAVEKAFAGHPREDRWREAVRRVRN